MNLNTDEKMIVVQFMAGDKLHTAVLEGGEDRLAYKFEKLEDGQTILRAWAGNRTLIVPAPLLVSVRMVL